jgi:hypothetical protein
MIDFDKPANTSMPAIWESPPKRVSFSEVLSQCSAAPHDLTKCKTKKSKSWWKKTWKKVWKKLKRAHKKSEMELFYESLGFPYPDGPRQMLRLALPVKDPEDIEEILKKYPK